MRRVDRQIRAAAAVIAAREGERGLEVLVLERGLANRFLPGYVAFPGGATDDADSPLAERWFGSAEEAHRVCAVRELLEEVGLALAAGGLSEANGRSLESLDDAPPRREQLTEIARWVAPRRVPVRFDARYFAVEAPRGLRVVPDGEETADAWWASPQDVLEDWRTERRKLYWPTFFTMRAIASCPSVERLLALRIDTREPNPEELGRLPRATFWQDEP
jgi:8-oxo-dGTP pyrophosphatase MutT (NUDIX family)